MSSEKDMKAEIERNNHALKEMLADLYIKAKDGALSDDERKKLDETITKIKSKLEPKTRAVCKKFGIPTDSELLRARPL